MYDAYRKIADWSKINLYGGDSLRLALKNGTLEQDDFNEIFELARMEHGLLEKNKYYSECENRSILLGMRLNYMRCH
ncbi:hypothetical protein EAO14_28245 [Klebsiella pneumoniae]|nr:hypothetical protein EAO14_28245 [Klebsiella pneumoniae]